MVSDSEVQAVLKNKMFGGLNPCCNGIWSQTLAYLPTLREPERLNPCCNGIWSQTVYKKHLIEQLCSCLNPCCNGIWSQTERPYYNSLKRIFVLILVVMEYGLRQMEGAS